MLCLYDADESAVASVQSHGLFRADVRAAISAFPVPPVSLTFCFNCSVLHTFSSLHFTSRGHRDNELHSAARVSASSVVEGNVETT